MSDLQTQTKTHTELVRKSEMSDRQHYKEQIVEAATSSTSVLLEHTLTPSPLSMLHRMSETNEKTRPVIEDTVAT